MCDYSVYEKASHKKFSMTNPKAAPKHNHENKIRFTIVLFERKLNIVIYKDMSLEDLYIKIYNAVYPEFSTEKMWDSIPLPNASTTYKKIPKIYSVSVIDREENIVPVPLHRHISIDSFMKTKRDHFQNIAFIGMPTFKIYAVDENFLEKSKNSSLQKTSRNYIQKFMQCYTSSKNK